MKRSRIPGTFRGPASTPAMSAFWNGEPCEARKVRVVVADSGEFPAYWARDLVGTERDAVEVAYNGETFYLDDEADPDDPESRPGAGWGKVTAGHGSPRWGHRGLDVDPESVVAR